MASQSANALKVHLHSADGASNHGPESIRVTHGDPDAYLDISFRRTIRVPDNEKSYELPPDYGKFPVFSVNEFKSTLPAEVSAKGGCFIPIYQREAMWIKFKGSRPFAIKVYAGGVNVVSGEKSVADMATMLRRKTKLSQNQSIQDYVVAPDQEWLDGIAKLDGQVMQFVATTEGSGYSIEAQTTGSDSVGGLQFEIVPVKHNRPRRILLTMVYHRRYGDPLPGDEDEIQFLVRPTTRLGKVINNYCARRQGTNRTFRFVYYGERIDDNSTPESLGMDYSGDIIEVFQSQEGGGGSTRSPVESRQPASDAPQAKTMVVAAGGLIKQTINKDHIAASDWDVKNTVCFNLQLISAGDFQSVTGLPSPPTPISAEAYAESGYPFFDMYEELSGIKGSFLGLKSVAEMDKENGIGAAMHAAEKDLDFGVVSISTWKSSFVPVSEMEAALSAFNFVDDL